MRSILSVFVSFAGLVLGPTAVNASIVFGQVDDFENGTTMGWAEGPFSPNPPTNVPSGGPSGAGDNYLQNVSSGGIGAGSRLVMFNQNQWTGDYTSAGPGVTRIEADMASFGATSLCMRVTISGGFFNTRYGSTNAVELPADGVWRPVSFDLTETAMTLILGTDSYNDVLQNVTELRILSAADGPSFMGDVIAATLGVDNITAVADCPWDCVGDDGVVGILDFLALLAQWGGPGSCDFDGGGVGINDFLELLANWGPCP